MLLSPRLGWIGVDVGTHAVKLAQTVRTDAGVRLFRTAVIQRSTTWPGDDGLGREQPLPSGSEIYAALKGGQFIGRDAICSLPMNVCELRGLSVPPGSETERHTMIADELAEDWAERRTPMEFDFWELDAAADSQITDGCNVNLLSMARPWTLRVADDCRQAGLACWAIDGVPLALARAVALAGGTRGGRRVLAVDWGYSSVTLAAVGEGRPRYVRSLHRCGFGQVLEAISRTMGVTLDEAQHLADTRGLDVHEMGETDTDSNGDHDVQAAITDAAADTIHELLHQIKRTLQFLESQRHALVPAAVWLQGGGATIRNLATYLTHHLQAPAHVWRVGFEADPAPCAAGDRAALFAVAAALSSVAWRAA